MYKSFWERRWAGKGLLGEWGEGRGLQFLVVTYMYLTNENRWREGGDPRAGICKGRNQYWLRRR